MTTAGYVIVNKRTNRQKGGFYPVQEYHKVKQIVTMLNKNNNDEYEIMTINKLN